MSNIHFFIQFNNVWYFVIKKLKKRIAMNVIWKNAANLLFKHIIYKSKLFID